MNKITFTLHICERVAKFIVSPFGQWTACATKKFSLEAHIERNFIGSELQRRAVTSKVLLSIRWKLYHFNGIAFNHLNALLSLAKSSERVKVALYCRFSRFHTKFFISLSLSLSLSFIHIRNIVILLRAVIEIKYAKVEQNDRNFKQYSRLKMLRLPYFIRNEVISVLRL